MSWKTIFYPAIAFVVFLLIIGYKHGKLHTEYMVVSVMYSMTEQYQAITQAREQSSTDQAFSISPDTLAEFFRNDPKGIQAMPPFVKLEDIMLPLEPVIIPSDEILFAVRVRAKTLCAITGGGETKIVAPIQWRNTSIHNLLSPADSARAADIPFTSERTSPAASGPTPPGCPGLRGAVPAVGPGVRARAGRLRVWHD